MTQAVPGAPEGRRLTPPISFMSANYVARELGYGVADDWAPCDEATNAAFSPLESFAARFDELLGMIRAAGFEELDLWLAHLNWRWATPEHVLIATEALDRHGLRVVSMAGGFGSTLDELASACRLAKAMQAPLLGGMAQILITDRDGTVEVLRAHGVRLAVENHAEKSPAEVLATIGDAADVLGTAVDTGWYATQGYDTVLAIRELGDRIMHVHLKDVEQEGEHVTCKHGTGCARVAECVDVLVEIGYTGALSVEHEPYDFDPTEECAEMLTMLRRQLTTSSSHEERRV